MEWAILIFLILIFLVLLLIQSELRELNTYNSAIMNINLEQNKDILKQLEQLKTMGNTLDNIELFLIKHYENTWENKETDKLDSFFEWAENSKVLND